MLEKFADIIRNATETQIRADTSLGGALTLGSEGSLQVDYAPFDYVNPHAKVILVGITPGRQQATNALLEANASLRRGDSIEVAARAAKEFASFSGPMRNNLVLCLDAIGIHTWLGIGRTFELWTSKADLVHFTSGIMYPTYVDKSGKLENWNGTPPVAKSPLLSSIAKEYLNAELRALPDAAIIALGPKAAEAIRAAGPDAAERMIEIPHPSGASTERSLFFAGKKPADQVSKMVDVPKYEAMRSEAIRKVEILHGCTQRAAMKA